MQTIKVNTKFNLLVFMEEMTMSVTYEQVLLDIQKLSSNNQLKLLKDLSALAEKIVLLEKKHSEPKPSLNESIKINAKGFGSFDIYFNATS